MGMALRGILSFPLQDPFYLPENPPPLEAPANSFSLNH